MQQSLHSAGFPIKSDIKYFQDKFSDLSTADDIVSDRRILRVVLGAYGLSADIENRYFIRTVLSEGMSESSALANKLADQRYRSLATDFDFSVNPPNHKTQPGLAFQTSERFRRQSFEEAVGVRDNDMRLALTFQRTLEQVAQSTSTNGAAWYQIMATPPLREVLQTALGFPQEFSNLDIDEQYKRFQDKAEATFGSNVVSELSGMPVSDAIIQRFLVVRQSSQISAASSFETALVLLAGLGTSRG
jgi:hypothetical protein